MNMYAYWSMQAFIVLLYCCRFYVISNQTVFNLEINLYNNFLRISEKINADAHNENNLVEKTKLRKLLLVPNPQIVLNNAK